MAATLKPRQSVSKGIRRIIRQHIDKALAEVDGADVDESIHSARKRFKRIRAGLRLIREGLPKKVYRRENDCFRNVSQYLTNLRDATVLLEALDPLKAAEPDQIDPDAISPATTLSAIRQKALGAR